MSANRDNELSPEQCRQLLGEAAVGRVVFTRKALPAVVPVRYRLVADDLVLGVAPGADWPALVAGTVFAFEVDRFGEPGGPDWSVVVVGRAQTDRPGLENQLVLDLGSALLTGTHCDVPAEIPAPPELTLAVELRREWRAPDQFGAAFRAGDG